MSAGEIRCFFWFLTKPQWDTRTHNWLRIWPIIDVPMPEGRYEHIYECRNCGVRKTCDTLVMDTVDEQIAGAVRNGHWNMP